MRTYVLFVACLGAVFSLAPLAIDMYLPAMVAMVAMAGYLGTRIDEVEAENYGLLVRLNAFAILAANIVNARLLYNIHPTRKAVAGAFILGGVGVTMLAFDSLRLGLVWIAAGVVAYVGMLGLVATNSIAGALARFNEDSGTGSAVYGVVQFGLGALSSLVISTLHSTDATAMVAVMAGCGMLALLSAVPLAVSMGRVSSIATTNASGIE